MVDHWCRTRSGSPSRQQRRRSPWRWIDANKLPAYRVGEKTIRLREEDLDAIVRPANSPLGRVSDVKARHLDTTPTVVRTRRLTDGEAKQGLAALQRLRTLRGQLASRRGATPRPPAVELIREAREERAKRV
jgi:excisionase family DNA binding protein